MKNHKITMNHKNLLAIGIIASTLAFLCTFSGCVVLSDRTPYSAYIENETEYEKQAFDETVIANWIGRQGRTYTLGEYSVDFEKTYFAYEKEYKAKSDTDYSLRRVQKQGGTLRKNGEPLFDIFIGFEMNKTVRRSSWITLGFTKDKHRGKRKCVFVTGTNATEIPFDTHDPNFILQDDSVIPLSATRIQTMRAELEDGKTYILSGEHNEISGAILKVNGEDYAFLDFLSEDRTVLLKKDFSQTLSEAEKDHVTSIIFLLCLFGDRFLDENTEPVIDYDVLEG